MKYKTRFFKIVGSIFPAIYDLDPINANVMGMVVVSREVESITFKLLD